MSRALAWPNCHVTVFPIEKQRKTFVVKSLKSVSFGNVYRVKVSLNMKFDDLAPKPESQSYPKPALMLAVVAAAVFTAEALIMMLFAVSPGLTPAMETVIDSITLTVILIPIVYFVFYRPFVNHIEDLKASELRLSRFTTAIDQGAEAIVITDTDGNIQYANPAFTRLTGYTLEEALGKNPRILKSGVHEKEFYANLWNTIKSGRVWVGEITSRRKDGSLFIEDVRISPVFGAEGEIINFVAVKLDVTERRRAEWEREEYLHRVKELSDYNKNLIEKAPVGAWVIDFAQVGANGGDDDQCAKWHHDIGLRIITENVNGRMCEMLGRPKEEIIGKSIFDPMFVDEENAAIFARQIKARKAGAKGNYEINLLNARGEKVPTLVEAIPSKVSLATGRVVQSLGMFVDLTERKVMEEQQEALIEDLNRANEELKDFAYIVSHDLKAPLRAISSLAEWVVKDYSNVIDEEGRENLQLLLGRARRMNSLIEGILRYSRIGRLKPELDELDTSKIVDTTIEALSPPPSIKVTVESELPKIIYDKTHFAQVFQNLISNAIKHMGKPSGKIAVSCADAGEFWEFRVKDDGAGIDEKHFDRIFKIFQSLKPRDELESTGIGLTLVKKIVETNGGRIWVESKVGEGSEFHFTIPKTRAAVTEAEDDLTSKQIMETRNDS